MKSFNKQIQKMTDKILMKNDKRGVAGLGLAKGFVIGILSIAVIIMLVLIVLGALNTQAIKDQTNNGSTYVVGNITQGILGLVSQFPTLFTILGVVMLVLLIVVIIVVMNRLGGSGTNDYTA